jgi:RsiW-degrading membrane proteinase PrsW (M82 family)
MNRAYVIYILIFILIVLSFFKDLITPDYLNSPHAKFIQELSTADILKSHLNSPIFWILSYGYTLTFILLPYFILKLKFNNRSAKILLYILISLAVVEYACIYINHPFLYKLVVPKINRYLHAPFILFFSLLILKLQKNNTADT